MLSVSASLGQQQQQQHTASLPLRKEQQQELDIPHRVGTLLHIPVFRAIIVLYHSKLYILIPFAAPT